MDIVHKLQSLDQAASAALFGATALLVVAFVLAVRHIDGIAGVWPLRSVIGVAWPVWLIALFLALFMVEPVGLVALLISAGVSAGIIGGDLITDRVMGR